MDSRRSLTIAAGLLLMLVGSVWALQGAGILPGSVMTDDRRWLVIGSVTALAGALLAYRGIRRT